jgi:chromosome condensin MukBEF complex kleisin-like MukF subunit
VEETENWDLMNHIDRWGKVDKEVEKFLKTAPTAKKARAFAAKWLRGDVGQQARQEAENAAEAEAEAGEQVAVLLLDRVLEALADEYQRPMEHMRKVVAQAIDRLKHEAAIRADLDTVPASSEGGDPRLVMG